MTSHLAERELLDDVYRRVNALTDREFWQGIMYLGISQEIAADVRRTAALHCKLKVTP